MAAPARSDYDGDSIDDVASYGAQTDGHVIVEYSSGRAADILDSPSTGAAYGFANALASGDFDHDGYADLAVGDPFADVGTVSQAGRVWVFFGSATGLKGSGRTPVPVDQALAGVPGAAESGDQFGGALAVGDADHDGYADLAVGVPGEAVGSLLNAGAVDVIRGKAGGLDLTTAYGYDQATDGVDGDPESGDQFGSSVAFGDVTGDGKDDLVVAAAGENSGYGIVHLLKGAAPAPTGSGSTSVTSTDLPGPAEGIGASLAVGDLTGDGKADVAAGASEGVISRQRCGTVAILRGSAAGIATSAAQVVSEGTSGVPGACENGDRWGAALGIGDLKGNGKTELVVGSPGEAIGDLDEAGAYTVLPGSTSGATGTGSFVISQNPAAVPGAAEAEDLFSQALSLHDWNKDGRLDVVVGVPGEFVGDEPCGSFAILLSDTTGNPTTGSTAHDGVTYQIAPGTTLQTVGRFVA